MEVKEHDSRALQLVERLWDSVDRTLEARSEPLGVKELKELTGLTRELLALRSQLEGPQPREDAQERICVVLAEEARTWGQ